MSNWKFLSERNYILFYVLISICSSLINVCASFRNKVGLFKQLYFDAYISNTSESLLKLYFIPCTTFTLFYIDKKIANYLAVAYYLYECNENNSYLEVIVIFIETNVLNQPFDSNSNSILNAFHVYLSTLLTMNLQLKISSAVYNFVLFLSLLPFFVVSRK